MALDLQSPNFSGTAAIAGRGISNLGLESAGALGLQAVQTLKQEEAAKRQAALEQMRIGQEGGLALAQQGIARQGLLQQQDQFNQEQANKERANAQGLSQYAQERADKLTGIDQIDAQKKAELDLEKQKFMMVKQQQEMAKLVDEKAEKLHEKGAFASYGLLAMNQAKTPEEAQSLRMEILKEAKDKGFIDDTEYKNGTQSSISMFKNMLGYKVMQTGMAKEYQDMLPKPVKNQQGNVSFSMDPTTGAVNFSSVLTKPVAGDAQKDIISAEDNLNELDKITSSVPDEFFGANAVAQPINKVREWAQNLPVIGSVVKPDEKTKKTTELYSNLQGGLQNMSMQIIKELSGVAYSDSQLAFLKEILPTIGPTSIKSEFLGRAANLKEFFNRVKATREDLLSKGITIDNPQYKEEMLSNMKSMVNQSAPSEDKNSALRQFLLNKGHSPEQVDQYLKGVK